MIVDASSSLDYDIKDKKVLGVVDGVRQKTLHTLLNYRPNPYQSVSEFRRMLVLDFIVEGNAFIYFDGDYLYHLPAAHMTVVPDTKTFVSGYKYIDVPYTANEIIHIKDLGVDTIYRGRSRLSAADRSIQILYKMHLFQEQFFKNNAVMGLIFTSDNTLSDKAKEKTIQHWMANYSPNNGARKPVILDSGLKPAPGVLNETFREMDFDVSISTHSRKILQALGVPPILLDGGNNANISPNLRLFYLETVLPICNAFNSAFERYFGYDLGVITTEVSALQPELKEISSYYVGLVNGGVITPNEARLELRYEKIDGHDELRIPANIAGSAADPNMGGAPRGNPNETNQ